MRIDAKKVLRKELVELIEEFAPNTTIEAEYDSKSQSSKMVRIELNPEPSTYKVILWHNGSLVYNLIHIWELKRLIKKHTNEITIRHNDKNKETQVLLVPKVILKGWGTYGKVPDTT